METSLTIAKAAEAAAVGVETVRYYERRGLIPQPTQKVGAYRRYDSKHVARIRFIKRAQELGFTLEEIAEATCARRRDRPAQHSTHRRTTPGPDP